MQPFQICIGPIIRIGRESWCLPYAGFFWMKLLFLRDPSLKHLVAHSSSLHHHLSNTSNLTFQNINIFSLEHSNAFSMLAFSKST